MCSVLFGTSNLPFVVSYDIDTKCVLPDDYKLVGSVGFLVVLPIRVYGTGYFIIMKGTGAGIIITGRGQR